ncbi:DUF5685 family protein [Actinocorallia sp. B10E7]|uniref:DUF5685 family protein n=1 Tax=Actinocorallia sp. B10E7 TaxID=3153558 RepID=UPI00325DCCE6
MRCLVCEGKTMFGVVRPCRHGMCTTLFKDWMAHLCGLCLTLRDEHGHRARLVTNYDGLLVSVLTEAQSAETSPRRKAGACALRGFKSADVVTARAEGARLAAAVSLLLAAGKTRDHIADGDGPYARRPVAAAAGRMADRWDAAGGTTGEGLGFDVDVLRDAVARQTVLERTPGLTLLELLEPTETAVAAAFAHTAVLAGRPGNAEPLAEAGRFFGRLAHLLDAVEDLPADHSIGAFNPLTATDTPLREARRLCDESLHGLRLALAEVEFEDRALVKALLEREVRKAVDRTFQGHPYAVFDEPSASSRGGLPVLPAVGQYPPPGHYPPPGQVPPGYRPPKSRPGCGPELCLAGSLVGCTCGLWRPEWSEYHGSPCSDRCACTRCDGCGDCCSGCDGCSNCCGDGCCCDCGCDC